MRYNTNNVLNCVPLNLILPLSVAIAVKNLNEQSRLFRLAYINNSTMVIKNFGNDNYRVFEMRKVNHPTSNSQRAQESRYLFCSSRILKQISRAFILLCSQWARASLSLVLVSCRPAMPVTYTLAPFFCHRQQSLSYPAFLCQK